MARIPASGRENVAVAGTAVGLTTGTLAGKVYCLVSVQTAPLRITFDGTTATTNLGHVFNIGDTFEVWGTGDMGNLSAIRDGGTSGALEVTYFGADGV